MIIKQFIANGWHTLPLDGVLERLADGKKSLPIFEYNWKDKYKKEFNKKETLLAGALTGKISNIIALDCDTQQTYDLFTTLDPTYTFRFDSLNKPSGGGTIIYKYTNQFKTFKVVKDNIALDFLSDESMIYLPTENNLTKVPWKYNELPPIKELPKTILTLLKFLTYKSKPAEVVKSIIHNFNRLAPMLDPFVKSQKYEPNLFKILTPKSFRTNEVYVIKGHMHPNDVLPGQGSEYMSKISAIIGADISVNAELYTKVIIAINKLWSNPMDDDRLSETILNPMLAGKVKINNSIVWQYDKDWQKLGYIVTASNNNYIESFFDIIKKMWYVINHTEGQITAYTDKKPVLSILKTLTGLPLNEATYDSRKLLVKTVLDPTKEFGHISNTSTFNLFNQSPALKIINEPQFYTLRYKRPKVILEYLTCLVPDNNMRSYLLSFIRTKLTTFKYSPVVLYFIGIPGSGKDTFVNILQQIIGIQYTARPDAKVFLENHNGWILDKYFIQLDEYGDKLSTRASKQEALGRIKSYSGSAEIQIRAMRQDGFNYKHSSTIILTANKNPLTIEIEDRRIAFIVTPNRLDKQDWVKNLGGIINVIDSIKDEILDLCYYLATEIKNLDGDNYVIAPFTEDKEKVILASMSAVERIMHYIKVQNFKALYQLGINYDIPDFIKGWSKSRLYYKQITELYDRLTDGAGSPQIVTSYLKQEGIGRQHTTENKENVYYFTIPGLSKYKIDTNLPTQVMDGQFKSIDASIYNT